MQAQKKHRPVCEERSFRMPGYYPRHPKMTFYREATFGVIDPVITGSKSLECFSPDPQDSAEIPANLSHTVEFVGVSFVEYGSLSYESGDGSRDGF